MNQISEPVFYQRFLYWFSTNFCHFMFRVFWRLEVVGAENVPSRGGCLIASNHISLVDPPLVGSSVKRPIYYFAKEELFRLPILGWYIRQINAFPVKRFEHDVGAFKHAQILLRNGEAVLLFPEGRRSKTGEIGKAKPGVGMLAYKTNVPVVPVYVENSSRLKRFKKLKVVFGKPLYPPKAENEKDWYRIFSDQVMEAVIRLKSGRG